MEQDLKQQLIARFHLDELPANEQDEILADAAAIVMESVLARTIPLLSESDGAACDELLASDKDIGEVFEFVKSKVARFQDILDEEIRMLEKTLV